MMAWTPKEDPKKQEDKASELQKRMNETGGIDALGLSGSGNECCAELAMPMEVGYLLMEKKNNKLMTTVAAVERKKSEKWQELARLVHSEAPLEEPKNGREVLGDEETERLLDL
jgi:hypothetical protein